MSVSSIKKSLEIAINNITPAIDTAWVNAGHEPTTGTPYQEVIFRFATPDNNEYNGAHYRELGYIQINLMYPLGVGGNDADIRAGLIRTAFSRGNSFTFDGITTVIHRTPEISGGFRDGARFKTIIKIPFYTNYT